MSMCMTKLTFGGGTHAYAFVFHLQTRPCSTKLSAYKVPYWGMMIDRLSQRGLRFGGSRMDMLGAYPRTNDPN